MNLTKQQINELALRGDLAGWLAATTAEEGDCLIWQGVFSTSSKTPIFRAPRVYPAMPGRDSRNLVVRRIVWELKTGKRIPDGWVTWSTCGVAGCVSPDHLRCTSKPDSLKAQARMGMFKRSAAGIAKIRNTMQAKSCLNWDAVHEIRNTMASTPRAQVIWNGKTAEVRRPEGGGREEVARRLAEKFGVSISSIRHICANRQWLHASAQINPFSQLLARHA